MVILSQDNEGTGNVYAETKCTGYAGPAITDATFASIGVPAANSARAVAFRASMTPALGGVSKADADGIFMRNIQGSFTDLARTSKPAGATGANFSAFKDPVLAEDDGLAFPATIKGGAVRGIATRTLWWQTPGGALGLLAQGGGTNGAPTDLPTGAQWSSFTSLAIASARGPIFAATLVPGHGQGVSKATASGVWAMDFNGTLRTLFRTGDTTIISGRTLKSFTLLNASVGSTGVTRSFNSNGQVAWLATFTNNTQAIVVTEVP
jgi:hypothetical protein